MIPRLSAIVAWMFLAALATCVRPRELGAAIFAVAATATVAHGLDLYRHVTDALDVPSDDDDGAAGGSA